MYQTEKLLFVENPKTASTTIGKLLSDYCDVSPITPRHGNLSDNIFEGGVVDKSVFKVITFVVVRNPVDRMISFWQEDHNKLTFKEWFNKGIPEWQFKPQTYYVEGVDRVLRYENLEEEFQSLMSEVGYDIKLPPKPKSNYPKVSITFAEVDLIYSRFKEDVDKWGYNVSTTTKPKKAGRPKKKVTEIYE